MIETNNFLKRFLFEIYKISSSSNVQINFQVYNLKKSQRLKKIKLNPYMERLNSKLFIDPTISYLFFLTKLTIFHKFKN